MSPVKNYYKVLVFFVANIAVLCGIKRKVADRSNQAVDTESNDCEEEVATGSRSETFGFKTGVVDD